MSSLRFTASLLPADSAPVRSGVSAPSLQLELQWNRRGLLEEIRILDRAGERLSDPLCGQSQALPGTTITFYLDQVTELTRLPPGILVLVQQLVDLLETGKAIEPVPWHLLDIDACTEFQRRVYEATVDIPSGETRTYGWVARRMGMPQAARAVGQALGSNPYPLLIPCHRVIKTDGDLGGYMGGRKWEQKLSGTLPLSLKQHLLNKEHAYRNPIFDFLVGFAVMPPRMESLGSPESPDSIESSVLRLEG